MLGKISRKSILKPITNAIFVLAILIACESPDEIEVIPSAYIWDVSTLSRNAQLQFYNLEVADGDLYAYGYEGSQYVFAKLVGDNWETLLRLDDWGIGDFTFFRDTIYFSTQNGIRKGRGTTVRDVLNIPSFVSLEVYHDQLIIASAPFPYNGADYTIMSYDGDKTFTPIDQGMGAGKIRKISDKLFIEGYPMKILNGSELISTDYWGGCLNIDSEGSIYSWLAVTDSLRTINRMVNGKLETVGKTIKTGASVDALEFTKKVIIFVGYDSQRNKWKSFYLDSDNEWRPVESVFTVSHMINFGGRVLSTSEGQLIEFRRNNRPS